MHTAICTFDNRDTAQQAVDRLLQAGFDRHDIHMEHRHSDGSPMSGPEHRQEPANDAWDGLEREVAVGPDLLHRFAFFERLFGDKHADHAERYKSAADRGHCVVVVDAKDEVEAERAQNVLHGMESGEFQLLHRAGQRPVRDIVAERQGSLEQRFGTAREEMDESHRRGVSRDGELFPVEERERAMASQGWGEQRTLPIIPDDPPSPTGARDDGDVGGKPR